MGANRLLTSPIHSSPIYSSPIYRLFILFLFSLLITKPLRDSIILWTRIIVIVLAGVMIAYITYDTLRNISFIADPRYMKIQLWICIAFLVDILIETLLSPHKLRFLLRHTLFILICIPYLNIFSSCGVTIAPELYYVFRFMPMIRAAFVLAIVCGGISGNWVQNLFSVYLILLLSAVYFCSLMFFVDEHYLNPDVRSYWDSLWWSIMAMTTTGCNINPVTPTGKVISVVLSAGGLILFPVFTVYITSRLTKDKNSSPGPAPAPDSPSGPGSTPGSSES